MFNALNMINPSKLPIINSYQNFPTKYYKFLHLLNGQTIPQMVKVKPMLFIDDEIKSLLNTNTISFNSSFDEIKFPKYSESVDQVIGSYFKTSMVDAELVKSFQAARYAGVSLKEPLLDIDLIKYMAGVSQDIKIKNGEKKYVLKQIAHSFIPKKLLDRPKSGFDIPFSSWLNGPLKELVFDQINESRLKNDAIFNIAEVIKIRDAFYGGNDAYKYKLWTLFLFQLWYKNNIKD
jgi:asparagine synthase (glutamine-hydrolysing)